MTLELHSSIVGRRLTGLFYDLFNWSPLPSRSSAVDAVPMGVILRFENSESATFRWVLHPPVERLALVRSEDYPPGPLVRRVEVSSRWSQFVGTEATDLSWSQQRIGDDLLPWAATLAFGSAGELVVALGELAGGEPSYLPDSLLVTASHLSAASYWPSAALSAAWTPPRQWTELSASL